MEYFASKSSLLSQLYGVNDFSELTEQQFMKYFKDLSGAVKDLTLENKFLSEYILKIGSIDDLDDTKVDRKSQVDTIRSGVSITSSRSLERKPMRRILGSFIKTELLLQVMEQSQRQFNEFKETAIRNKDQYKAEYEEGKITSSELNEAQDTFKTTVVIQGFNQLTQRIPAEKFLRFMNDWTKIAQMTVQKLILYNSSERVYYKTLKSMYISKSRLAENIHAVDFDQLAIENKNMQIKLENTSKHVKKLKEINGRANVIASSQTNFLKQQGIQMKNLRTRITQGREYIILLKKESEKVNVHKTEAIETYESHKKLTETFWVPETIQYIRLKAQLLEAKKKYNICKRRNSILNITLDACVVQMKNTLRTNKVTADWFKNPNDVQEGSISNS